MPRPKREYTVGSIVFNIIFVLAYPIIAIFSAAFTVIVWVFSLPSRLFARIWNR